MRSGNLGGLDRAVVPVPPLLPRSGVAADVVEAGQLVEDEPRERRANAALAVRRPDLAGVRAGRANERDHLVDRPERALVGQQVAEIPQARARDVPATLRPEVGADVLARRPDVEDAGRGVGAAARLAAPGQDLVVGRDERVVALAELDRDPQGVGEIGLGDVGRRRLFGASPGFDAAIEDVDPAPSGTRRGGAASSRGSRGGSGRRRRRGRPGRRRRRASGEGPPPPARGWGPATRVRRRRSPARCRAGRVPCGGRCRSRRRCGACCRPAGRATRGRAGDRRRRGGPPATRR